MILLYHSVFPDDIAAKIRAAGPIMSLAVFKRHILWLVEHYRMVSLNEYLAGSPSHGSIKSKRIALTFDDGFRTTFQSVSPFLNKYKVPATFFVSTGHLEHGELLWFSYLNALCFERLYTIVEVDQQIFHLDTLEQCRKAWYALSAFAKTSGDPVGYSNMLAKVYPISPDVAALYEGMTYEQLNEAGGSDLLEIGGHTITHPFLSLSPLESQEQEILEGKRLLSELLGKPIRYFAYPGGEYNTDTIKLVRAAGFEAAFAVTPKNLGEDSQLEIERVGIYSHSLFKVGLKTLGVAGLARRFGIHIG